MLLAHATNLGLTRMADACGIPCDVLAWTAEWYVREETLRAANLAIIGYHRKRKRMASIVKKARAELEEIRLRQRETSERLIGTYRTVLEHLDPDGETASQAPGQGAARAVAAVEEAGGFAAQLAGIEEVSAFHGDNYEVLVHRFFRKDRAVMFELAGKLELVATSSDAPVLAALKHARANQGYSQGKHKTRHELILN